MAENLDELLDQIDELLDDDDDEVDDFHWNDSWVWTAAVSGDPEYPPYVIDPEDIETINPPAPLRVWIEDRLLGVLE